MTGGLSGRQHLPTRWPSFDRSTEGGMVQCCVGKYTFQGGRR